MLLPGRHGSSDSYRYGFNGKEKDDELKGEGNSYDYGARMLDTRIGRWMSCDKVIQPHLTPYNFSSNNPIIFIDPDGNTDFWFNGQWIGTDGVSNNLIAVVKDKSIVNDIVEKTKLGQDHAIDNPFNGMNNATYFVVDKNILSVASKGLAKQMDDENYKFREYLAVMDNKGGDFVTIEETTSPEYDVKKPGTADSHSTKQGTVKIHGHPIGQLVETKDEKSYKIYGFEGANKPSVPNDEDDFKKQEMNIIVGVNGENQLMEKEVRDDKSTGSTAGTIKRIMVPVERLPFINFYGMIINRDEKGNAIPVYSLPREQADNIVKGDRGKKGKKYDKAKQQKPN